LAAAITAVAGQSVVVVLGFANFHGVSPINLYEHTSPQPLRNEADTILTTVAFSFNNVAWNTAE
ncbi:MAG TPA: hypothetical protein VFT87_03920, partial [Candidatus Saccharimonadales bacterium]|nr:hypothetical protein [Candidatus Saccharimonadales bacterium]